MSSILEFFPFDNSMFDKFNNIIKYSFMPSIETIETIGIDIGKNIEQNTTVFNNYMNNYMNKLIVYIIVNWEYVSVILSSFTICFIIGLLLSLLEYEIKMSKKIILNDENDNDNDNDNDNKQDKLKLKGQDNNINNINNINTNASNKITYPTGLYCESIREIVSKNDEIISKIGYNNNFWMLLRVVMKNPIAMKRSKYVMHGNNVGNSRNRVFKTRDMYMIFKMKYFSGNNPKNINGSSNYKFSMANSVIGCMNYWNHISPEEYKTCDFVLVAISDKTNHNNPREFYDGLINNNYEMFNFKDIVINLDNKMRIGYTLMLPIHEIYDIFMDVYNINIFESNKYLIDDDNYESWNDKSINELKF